MSAQLDIESVVTHGVERRLEFYGGYSFGWPGCCRNVYRYVSAVVVTPRYIERAAREVDPKIPFVIDNGAFSAWHNDRQLTLMEQAGELNRAIHHVGPGRVKFVVWPDVVGSPRRTWQRINRTFRCFNHRLAPALIPVQEGMNPLEQAQLAAHRDGGVFIGGESRQWKLEQVRIIRARFPDLHIHVGRLSSEGHLHTACAYGATSFDTTTFFQGRGSNQRTDYRPRLRLYAKRRALTAADWQEVVYR